MNNTKPSTKVVAHSKHPLGDELITLEIELHRFILPEFNTHRSVSRNFQSSRAVPVEKMLEQVRNDPALPVHWGKNQRGMVAEEECSNKIVYFGNLYDMMSVDEFWRDAAESSVAYAECLVKAGYHKQIVNRLLEPFMWTKGVVTATREAFEAFFKLRCAYDAQPEIKLLAERMREAIGTSKLRKLKYGEWHLPYSDHANEDLTIKDKVKVSTSCCAQVSFRVLDDSLDKAKKIYDMLNLPTNGVFSESSPHFSPTEHQALCMKPEDNEGLTGSDVGGNFQTKNFFQYRKMLERGVEGRFI